MANAIAAMLIIVHFMKSDYIYCNKNFLVGSGIFKMRRSWLALFSRLAYKMKAVKGAVLTWPNINNKGSE